MKLLTDQEIADRWTKAIDNAKQQQALIEEQARKLAKLEGINKSLLAALKGMLEWARRVKEINPGMEVAIARQAITKAKE